MRPIERIDNFLGKVDWKYLLEDRWKITPIFNFIKLDHITSIGIYWRNNPDQRIGQVLENLGMINGTMMSWNDEEHDILIDQDIAPEDCLYWTSIFNKNGQKLLQPVTKLISELDIDHINAILVDPRLNLSNLYKQSFKNVIEKGQ
jgi:hypothetical protein